jgi:hypothetical protein
MPDYAFLGVQYTYCVTQHLCIQYHCKACYTMLVLQAALHIPVYTHVVTQLFEGLVSDVTYQIIMPHVYYNRHRIPLLCIQLKADVYIVYCTHPLHIYIYIYIYMYHVVVEDSI